MASRESVFSPENNQHLPDLSWLAASGDSIRLLKVKFCLSTSFLLNATAAIPFSVTAFKASMFPGFLLNDRQKRLISSRLKLFPNSFPNRMCMYFHR